MGKAAIYNPYLDTLGGGEKYTLSFAKVLADNGWTVDVEWKEVSIKLKLEKRLGIDLSNVNFVNDIKKGSGYNLCFWVSDGSIPLLHSRKNILHFQVPFHEVDGRALINRMKLFRINKVICNSKFTKKIIDAEFGINSRVVYPPIDVSKIKPKRKENLILYVGRFSDLIQSKRQDILVEAFKKISRQIFDWKLVLIGGSEVGGKNFVSELRKKASGYNIEILEGIDYKALLDFYGRAKFFWSAAGFGVNQKNHPEQLEHFGMSTVEAMAAGAVPLIFNAGGASEIINDGVNGYLWENLNHLLKISLKLINDGKKLRVVSQGAKERSKYFNLERFNEEILKLL